MVATPHHLASAAGLHALRAGESAVDAAIAANAVLCVVYPHMGGLGGDGFWLIHGAETDGVEALDASGPAAAAATRDWYAERGHAESIPPTTFGPSAPTRRDCGPDSCTTPFRPRSRSARSW